MKNILVIEDNWEVLENIAEILEICDYQVSKAENGKLGIQKALKESPDLILCDILMPELDGFGVLNILEKKPQTANIPFIFLTAKTDTLDIRKGMRLGADDYITKPFEALELLEAVEMRLKKNERLKNSYWDPASRNPFFDEHKVMKELETISGGRTIKKFNTGEAVYREYEHPHALYLVLSGTVKVVKMNIQGKEFILDICKPGSFLGYNALIEEVNYAESAVALEPSEVSLIPKDEFFHLLFTNRNFSAMFIKMMANNTQRKEDQILSLAYSSNRKRVAEALLYLMENQPPKEGEKLGITRNDLAQIIGSAKETVSRTISDFKKEGLIDIREGEIFLKNVRKLQQLPD